MKKLFILLTVVFLLGDIMAVNTQEIEKIKQATPSSPPAPPKKPRKLMVFNLCKGYKHNSIEYVAKALEIIGEKTGAYQTVQSSDMTIFNAENLREFDAICFNNTTGLTFDNISARVALMDFVKSGKGIVGIHAATDNFYNWPEAAEMMGALFVSHPWTAGGTWAVKINDPDSIINEPFDPKGFKIKDEIYLTRQLNLKKNARILLSLDFSDPVTLKQDPTNVDVPISWIREFGKGRVFYCSLGHNKEILWNKSVLKHYLNGIQFALGDLNANTTPTGPDAHVLKDMLTVIKDYDYSMDRIVLTKIRQYLKIYYDDKNACAKFETILADFLKSDATFTAKQFICRQLRIIGSEASVEPLGQMLKNPEYTDIARYALELMPGEKADQMFREAVSKTSGKEKIAIINSIGKRKDNKAIKQLTELAKNKNTAISLAAIDALGNIASPQAFKQLNLIAASQEQKKLNQTFHAILNCARNYTQTGNPKKACVIYRALYKNPNASDSVKASAVKNWMLNAPSSGFFKINPHEILERVLKDDNSQLVKTSAIAVIDKAKDRKLIKTVAKLFPSQTDDLKVKIIYALSNIRKQRAADFIIQAAQNQPRKVKLAALKAIASVGGPQQVMMLAKTAANSSGPEQNIARSSLYTLKGQQVDEKIISLTDTTAVEVKKELIKAAAQRKSKNAVETLLKYAGSDNTEIAIESLKSLTVLAEPEHFEPIMELAAETANIAVRRQIQKTTAVLSEKTPPDMDLAKTIIEKLQKVSNPEKKVTLISLFEFIPNQTSFNEIKKYLNSENEKIKTQAVRTLANWQNSTPTKKLFDIAQNSNDKIIKTLALRGCIRQIKYLDAESSDKAQMYKKALSIAQNINEKRMVLSEAAEMKSPAGLNLANQYLTNPQLKNEAFTALLSNAEEVYATYKDTSKILTSAREVIADEEKVKKIDSIIKKIDQINSHIVRWLYAGPYSQKEKDAMALFNIPFDPEKSPETVNWKQLDIEPSHGKPWLIEIHHKFPHTNKVIYLKTNIYSPKQTDAILEMGSDDGVKAWINKKLVHENNIYRAASKAQDKTEIQLNQGWNELMMKINQGGGQWAVIARIADPNGKNINGLKQSLK